MITSQSAADFFVARTFTVIGQWPLHEQRDYLAGLLTLTGDNDPVVVPLRRLLGSLNDAHSQIQLFASGQMPLDLNAR